MPSLFEVQVKKFGPYAAKLKKTQAQDQPNQKWAKLFHQDKLLWLLNNKQLRHNWQ